MRGQVEDAFHYIHNNDARGFVHKSIFKEGSKVDNGAIINAFNNEFGGVKSPETKWFNGQYGLITLRVFMQDPNAVSKNFSIIRPHKFNGNHRIQLRSKRGAIMSEILFNKKKDYLNYMKSIFGN